MRLKSRESVGGLETMCDFSEAFGIVAVRADDASRYLERTCRSRETKMLLSSKVENLLEGRSPPVVGAKYHRPSALRAYARTMLQMFPRTPSAV